MLIQNLYLDQFEKEMPEAVQKNILWDWKPATQRNLKLQFTV